MKKYRYPTLKATLPKTILVTIFSIVVANTAVAYDCSGPVLDYESGNYLYLTDHETKCESAVEEACDNSYRRCVSECPSGVYDYNSGNYLYNTDVNSKCKDACGAGKRYCEP